MSAATEHIYVARAACGCLTGAAVDTPNHKSDTARCVGDWVRRGDSVQRMTDAKARELMGKLVDRGHLLSKCPHGNAPGKRRAKP